MEKVDTLRYMFLGLVCLFSFFANLSTEQGRRRQFYLIALIAALLFLGILALNRSDPEFAENWIIAYNLFVGTGVVLPQFVSRILVRQKIGHPVIFLKKKKVPLISIIFVGMAFVLLAWVTLIPKEFSYATGGPVYDEFYVRSSFSFLVFFVPLIIFSIQMLVERDAICESGFYHGGLLLDWSNFKSYSWSQDKMYTDPEIQPFLDQNTRVELTIEPKQRFFGRSIHLIIPLDEKNMIDNLLSRKFNGGHMTAQEGHTHTTPA